MSSNGSLQPVFLVDTREHPSLAYRFQGYPTRRQALPAGDYSLAGLEDRAAVERKTLGDLTACLGVERERFVEQMARMKALDFAALVVEADLRTLARGDYRSQLHPRALLGSLAVLPHRFRVHVFFASTPALGELWARELLLKYLHEREKVLELARRASQEVAEAV